MDLQISCINKTDRYSQHERVSYAGGLSPNGTRWRYSQQQIVAFIDSKMHSFYTMVNGRRANVITATHNGNKYIKTENDGDQPNNLLSLSECSI